MTHGSDRRARKQSLRRVEKAVIASAATQSHRSEPSDTRIRGFSTRPSVSELRRVADVTLERDCVVAISDSCWPKTENGSRTVSVSLSYSGGSPESSVPTTRTARPNRPSADHSHTLRPRKTSPRLSDAGRPAHASDLSIDFRQSDLSKRDSARSARSLPPVWQRAQ